MEFAAHSLRHLNLSISPSCSSSLPPFIFDPKYSNSFGFQCSRSFPTQLLGLSYHRRGRRNLLPLYASDSNNSQSPANVTVRWLLVPVGDGDWRHIGSKVEMPDAFEIVSNEVTVGRLPDKADVVISVATVSGLHARIQKQEENLLITDLGSTNGTFINDRRLSPGVAAAVSSGNCIIFGDIHLAMFQVSRLNTVEAAEDKQQSNEPSLN